MYKIGIKGKCEFDSIDATVTDHASAIDTIRHMLQTHDLNIVIDEEYHLVNPELFSIEWFSINMPDRQFNTWLYRNDFTDPNQFKLNRLRGMNQEQLTMTKIALNALDAYRPMRNGLYEAVPDDDVLFLKNSKDMTLAYTDGQIFGEYALVYRHLQHPAILTDMIITNLSYPLVKNLPDDVLETSFSYADAVTRILTRAHQYPDLYGRQLIEDNCLEMTDLITKLKASVGAYDKNSNKITARDYRLLAHLYVNRDNTWIYTSTNGDGVSTYLNTSKDRLIVGKTLPKELGRMETVAEPHYIINTTDIDKTNISTGIDEHFDRKYVNAAIKIYADDVSKMMGRFQMFGDWKERDIAKQVGASLSNFERANKLNGRPIFGDYKEEHIDMMNKAMTQFAPIVDEFFSGVEGIEDLKQQASSERAQ